MKYYATGFKKEYMLGKTPWEYYLFWGLIALCWFIILPLGVFVLPHYVDEVVSKTVAILGFLIPILMLVSLPLISKIEQVREKRKEDKEENS